MSDLILICVVLLLYAAVVIAAVSAIATAAAYLVPVGIVLASLYALLQYLRSFFECLVIGEVSPVEPGGPDRSFEHYFFGQAWRDTAAIVRTSFSRSMEGASAVLRKAGELLRHKQVLFLWPIGLLLWLCAAALVVATFCVYAVLCPVHVLVVAFGAVAAFALATLLRGTEYAVMAYRRAFVACPYGDCQKKIPLPHYRCPECGCLHSRLMPGRYGILRRRCHCDARLPTLFVLGRGRIPSFCPWCGGALSGAMGRVRNAHFPIIAGRSSGKSAYLTALASELQGCRDAGLLSLEFAREETKQWFNDAAARMARGRVPEATVELLADAITFTLTDARRNRRLLYLYDPAGETYRSHDAMLDHGVYDYLDGAIVLLDPFALPSLADDASAVRDGRLASVAASTELPMDALANTIELLRAKSATLTGRVSVPVAIVLTKADALRRPPVDGSSESVERWLSANGEGNLVAVVHANCASARFFATSSLGRCSDRSGRPFTPQGVLEPLAWLLGRGGMRLPASSTER